MPISPPETPLTSESARNYLQVDLFLPMPAGRLFDSVLFAFASASPFFVLRRTSASRIFRRTMELSITHTDLIRLGLLTAAILVALGLSELLRRRLQIRDEVIRKSVHILTGLLIFFTPPFFPRSGAVVLIALTFVVFNTFAYLRGWLKAVHHTARASYGTVYYPLALLLLAAPLWNVYPDLVVAAIMVMAVGDAAAGIVGESSHRPRTFSVTSDPKSLQGSIAMVIGSFAALLLTLTIYDTGGLAFSRHFSDAPVQTLAALLAISMFVAAWEATSSRGLDNLTVPIAAAFALHLCFASGLPDSTVRFILGTLLGAGIALVAWRLRMLALSGAVVTFLLATVIFGIGGWKWTLPIFAFFILSSVLSKWRKNQKRSFEAMFEKSGTRDAGQVAANGGIAGLLILIWYVTMDERVYFLYLAALAVVTADTWGTEIGVLSKSQPRSILSFRKVAPGSSGGVSVLGTAGGALGAFIVVLTALPFTPGMELSAAAVLALVGVFGSASDSILGATVQAQYRCVNCGAVTERRRHCDASSPLIRGKNWINNDAVNVLSTLAGLLLAAALFMVR